MYKRYYDNYHSCDCGASEIGETITPRCAKDTYCAQKESEEKCCPDNCNEQKEIIPCCNNQNLEKKSLFSLPCDIDDIILIGILLLMMRDEDSSEPIIPIIIGFILLTGGF